MIVLYILIAGSILGMALALLTFGSQNDNRNDEKEVAPFMHDAGLVPELVAEGLRFPTSMAFLDDGNILVLEKNEGSVRLVSHGRLLDEPILRVNVTSEGERGLLGIAIKEEDKKDNTPVFLYLTDRADNGKVRNRVYSFDWDGRTLLDKTLVLDLPGEPGPYHNGGKIAIGPRDGHLYAIIGDLSAGGGMLDNQISGRPLDDQSVIFRVNRHTGMAVKDNPFFNYSGDMEKLRRYYAYGIRNSFGLDFDPMTGKLWITENGPENYDEINIVDPGFNSGWHKVMGPISRTDITISQLVNYDGSKYNDPVFSWKAPIGITDIEFFNSSRLGAKYENNVFVGDINNGNLYFFKVNQERDGLQLNSSIGLADLVADPVGDNPLGEASPFIIGEKFGRITDIETGPDGNLYLLTYLDGKIYRITSRQ